jgi:hypothetical protein
MTKFKIAASEGQVKTGSVHPGSFSALAAAVHLKRRFGRQ